MDKPYKNYLKLSNILKFSSLNYLQSFLSFSSSILLARMVGKELYGEYAFGLIFLNILSTLNQFGSEKTLIRDLVHNEEPKSVLKAATFINIAISTITLSSIFVWSYFHQLSFSARYIIIVFSIAGTCLGLSPIAWFDYKGKMNLQALLFVIEKLCYLTAVGFILFFSDLRQVALRAATAFLICRLLTATQEWGFVTRNFEGLSKKTWSYVKKLLCNNIWIWLAVIANLLMTQVNQLILRSEATSSQLAVYAVAFQLIMIIRLFQNQFLRLIAPSIADLTNKLVEKEANKVKQKMHKIYGFILLITFTFVLPLFIAAPFIVKILAGSEYLDSIAVFRILLVWIFLFGFGLVNNQFLIGFNLNRSYLIVVMFFGLMSIFLSYILIPIYQSKGAAISLLVSHSGSILSQFFLVEKFIHKLEKSHDQAYS